MRIKSVFLATAIAGTLLVAPAVAQQQHQHDGASKPPAGRGGMTGGMMGHGGMDMMKHCEQMMGARGAHPVPQLPPGNEKLQLQMHAEMMQRMGEILSKYAAQVK
jgi:hypothetical protein